MLTGGGQTKDPTLHKDLLTAEFEGALDTTGAETVLNSSSLASGEEFVVYQCDAAVNDATFILLLNADNYINVLSNTAVIGRAGLGGASPTPWPHGGSAGVVQGVPIGSGKSFNLAPKRKGGAGKVFMGTVTYMIRPTGGD